MTLDLTDLVPGAIATLRIAFGAWLLAVVVGLLPFGELGGDRARRMIGDGVGCEALQPRKCGDREQHDHVASKLRARRLRRTPT